MKKISLAMLLVTALSACEFKVKVGKPDEKPTQAVATVTPPDLPFPLKTDFSNEYLKATFWKCTYSETDPEHAYWIILPNTLRPTQIKPVVMKPLGLTGIGVYNTIDKTLPYIEVMVAYEKVDKTVAPTTWLLNKLKIMGENVLQQNDFKYEDGQQGIDVLTYKDRSGGKVISRFVEQSRGSDYYLIKVACSEQEYPAQAKTIFHVVSHWGSKDK